MDGQGLTIVLRKPGYGRPRWLPLRSERERDGLSDALGIRLYPQRQSHPLCCQEVGEHKGRFAERAELSSIRVR